MGDGGGGSEDGGVLLCRGLNKVHQEKGGGQPAQLGGFADWPCVCVYKVGWGEGAGR